MEIAPGTRIDRYELVEPIGEGGQATVWRARDPLAPGEWRAIKLLRLVLSRQADVERVRREARALARLEQPSLVRCHALFEDPRAGVLGMVMDLVEGVTLSEARGDPRFGARHWHLLLRHVAHALGYVHGQGLVHRDVKTGNVLVSPRFATHPEDPATVKLVDFGIAVADGTDERLTAQGAVIGTTPYLAPERLDPRHFGDVGVRPATDVFAFGVLGWRLLTGKHPTRLAADATLFEYASEYRTWDASLEAWPPGAPADAWGELLTDCLKLRAGERLRDGRELARRAELALGETDGVSLPAPSVGPSPSTAASLAEAPTEMDHGAAAIAAPRPALTAPSLAAPTQLSPIGGAAPAGAAGPLLGKGWGLGLAIGLAAAAASAALLWLPPAEKRRPISTTGAPPTALPPQPPRSGGPRPERSAAPRASAAGGDSGVPVASVSGAVFEPRLPPGCAAEADLCECCPTNRACGGAGCDAPLAANEVVHLRPMALYRGEEELLEAHPDWHVCVRRSGDPQRSFVCTRAADARGTHAPAERLRITATELRERGVDVQLQGATIGAPLAEVTRFRPARLSELDRCRGLEVGKLEGDPVVDRALLYLDPATEETPMRCDLP